MIKTRQELIEFPRDLQPHVVLLGAGASRAAFPNGDASGRPLPVMDDFVEIVGLATQFKQAGLEDVLEKNFETLYGRLASEAKYSDMVRNIERSTERYFSGLSLPSRATIYDRLLISLRPTDAVFTFNWDPFLFDAYQRNRHVIPLPDIFFLHGSVRVGACLVHDIWGERKGLCPKCSKPLVDVPLLYPIEQKDYSKNPFIRRNWHAAQILFRDAFTLTIFGYGAPDSDTEAVQLLRSAWMSRSDRSIEHIEIVDVANQSLLYSRWSPFSPTHHYRVTRSFEQSRLARWPRRSCESLLYPMTEGMPCEDFPLPITDNLVDLQTFALEISRYESKRE